MAERMVFDISSSDKPPHEQLSDRELEVLCLIASGRTVGEIATSLSLSDKTISTYRRRILDKMHLSTNAELTHYAIRNHLVE
jgi:DNA-binding NarL/FixJ family response regulator